MTPHMVEGVHYKCQPAKVEIDDKHVRVKHFDIRYH